MNPSYIPQRQVQDRGYTGEGEIPYLVTIRNVRQLKREWLSFKQRCATLGIPAHEGVRQALYLWMDEQRRNAVPRSPPNT